MTTATTSRRTKAEPAAEREPFVGFTRDAIDFLAELAANNDRAWFQPRKTDYERLVKRPLEALCIALAERFAQRGIPLESDPMRSPHRIYRDTRFARDKSPYRPSASARFPWIGPGGSPAATAVDAGPSADGPRTHRHGGPSGYFHLQPGEVYLGGGLWRPEPSWLVAWRTRVVDDPAAIRAAIGDPGFVRTFGDVHGDSLKRTPTGFPAEHPDAALLKLKDIIFGRRLSDAEALSPTLADLLADAFADAVPVLRLLASLDGQAG